MKVISYLFMKTFMFMCILIAVAFITLMERKILGYAQYRKGPNKMGFMGVCQPFADALKLISKEKMDFSLLNNFFFFLIPLFSLVLMLMFWEVISKSNSMKFNSEFELVLVMLISSLSVYIIIFMGWFSNSKYALLGAYRGVSQTISYEVGFSFILMSVILFSSSFFLMKISDFQLNMNYFLWGMLNLMFVWVVTILAETNRTPFDLAEGESELVSGFNVEYGGVDFALLFISEYGNILFMSWLSMKMFFGEVFLSLFMFLLLILIIRGTLIRYRYDKLMMLAWKSILPFSILMFQIVFFSILI